MLRSPVQARQGARFTPRGCLFNQQKIKSHKIVFFLNNNAGLRP